MELHKAKALVLADFASDYCDIANQVVWDLAEENFNVVLVDLGKYSLVRLGYGATTSTFGRRDHSGCYDKVSCDKAFISPPRKQEIRSFSRNLSKSELGALSDSLQSEVHSVFQDETPMKWDPIVRLWIARSEHLSLGFGAGLEKLMRDHRPQLVLIPNGRFPVQRMAAILAKSQGASVEFYERGFEHGAYFRQQFQTQNRIEVQEQVALASATVPRRERIRISDEWLKRRQTSSNEFYSSGEFEANQGKASRLVSIFPSSPDEFLCLSDWGRGKFPNQFEGFLDWLDKHGKFFDQITIRIHPNSVDKPLGHVLSELHMALRIRRRLRGTTVKIFSATSKVDSYKILESSQTVLVSTSTVGLEAALMAKEVWSLWDTAYDQVVGLRKWDGSGDADVLENNGANLREGGRNFIAGSRELDRPIGNRICLLPMDSPRIRRHPFLKAVWKVAESFRSLFGHVQLRLSMRRKFNRCVSRAFDSLVA